MLLEPVDTADQGRFAGPGRSADHDSLAAGDFQVDVLEYVKSTVPLVHFPDDDNRLGGVHGGCASGGSALFGSF